jgi:hypothetical protein
MKKNLNHLIWKQWLRFEEIYMVEYLRILEDLNPQTTMALGGHVNDRIFLENSLNFMLLISIFKVSEL